MRLQWATAALEQEWKPRLAQIHLMCEALEVESVRCDLRKAAIFAAGLGDRRWFDLKATSLHVVPVKVTKTEDYSNQTTPPGPNDPVTVMAMLSRTAIEVPKTDWEWGEILGYPQCCRTAFDEYWNKQGWRDPLRWQYLPVLGGQSGGLATAPISLKTNVILRVIGVRPVFHLPHSFDCKETVDLSHELKKLAFSLGFNETWTWMEALYSYEFSVSVKNGIGEIVHPLFRAAYVSDKIDFRVEFQKGIVRQPNGFETLWTDNGFFKLYEMEQAHQGILNELIGLQVRSLIDLGAGNGYLASKAGRLLGCNVRAIELDQYKIEHGKLAFPNVEFVAGDIKTTSDTVADLVMISYNRFLEGVKPKEVASKTAKYLVVYEYDTDIPEVLDLEGFNPLGTRNKKVHVYQRNV